MSADGNYTEITPDAADKIAATVDAVAAMPANTRARPNAAQSVTRICQTASPTAIPQGNGSPDSTTWVRDSTPPLIAGFTLKFVTSVNWDSSAGVLSYDYRTLTFDACGRCSNVSAESKVTVDTAVSCS